MGIKAVVPRTEIDGFECEIIRHPDSLLAGSDYEPFFVDHYLRLIIKNDRTNYQYPTPLALTVLITQYVEPCTIGIKITETDTPVCVQILQHYESLTSIRVMELLHNGVKSAVLTVWITDTRNQKVGTFGIGLATTDLEAFQRPPTNRFRHPQ